MVQDERFKLIYHPALKLKNQELPPRWEFYRLDDDYPFEPEHRLVAEWCRANDIPVLDTRTAFAGTPTEDLIVHPKDRHPNARAHTILGNAIADFLLTNE